MKPILPIIPTVEVPIDYMDEIFLTKLEENVSVLKLV
jgi:hypothetical protein